MNETKYSPSQAALAAAIEWYPVEPEAFQLLLAKVIDKHLTQLAETNGKLSEARERARLRLVDCLGECEDKLARAEAELAERSQAASERFETLIEELKASEAARAQSQALLVDKTAAAHEANNAIFTLKADLQQSQASEASLAAALKRIYEMMPDSPDQCEVLLECANEVAAEALARHQAAVALPASAESAVEERTRDDAFRAFGKAIFATVTERVATECMSEDDEHVMQIAENHGLAKRVPYDPAIHDNVEAEEGSIIWFWGSAESSGGRAGEDKS
jgi:chromosome segregation ATPase